VAILIILLFVFFRYIKVLSFIGLIEFLWFHFYFFFKVWKLPWVGEEGWGREKLPLLTVLTYSNPLAQFFVFNGI